MKQARSYFQSIARKAPQGAVVLRPQLGILQRWQTQAAPAWVGAAQEVPSGGPAKSVDRRVSEPPFSSKAVEGMQQGRELHEGAGPLDPARITQGAGSAPQIGASTQSDNLTSPADVSSRTMHATAAPVFAASPQSGAPAPREGNPMPLRHTGTRDLNADADAAGTSARHAGKDAGPMHEAGAAGVRRSAEPPYSVPPPALAAQTKPVESAIHIGAIEVHVTPPAPAIPIPAATVSPHAVTRKSPLSRGYFSRFGWEQS
jgi:hypothetical protein